MQILSFIQCWIYLSVLENLWIGAFFVGSDFKRNSFYQSLDVNLFRNHSGKTGYSFFVLQNVVVAMQQPKIS